MCRHPAGRQLVKLIKFKAHFTFSFSLHPPAASKEHVENVHWWTSSARASLFDGLFSTLIIQISLLWVWQHLIRLRYMFKLCVEMKTINSLCKVRLHSKLFFRNTLLTLVLTLTTLTFYTYCLNCNPDNHNTHHYNLYAMVGEPYPSVKHQIDFF